jgi:hypothetical protein
MKLVFLRRTAFNFLLFTCCTMSEIKKKSKEDSLWKYFHLLVPHCVVLEPTQIPEQPWHGVMLRMELKTPSSPAHYQY